MKRKHLTKDELLSMTKEIQTLKKSSNRSPFTGMATLCNYVLWKDEKWYQKKLVAYNQAVAEYDQRLDAEEVTIKDMSDRLWNKADFTVEYVEFTEKDIRVSPKNKFFYAMEKHRIECDNTINEMSTRYMLIHFNVLMDMGYGKKRLERNKDYINARLQTVTVVEGEKIMDLHRELIEGAGIEIEMPKL
jgi:hypothetical protein